MWYLQTRVFVSIRVCRTVQMAETSKTKSTHVYISDLSQLTELAHVHKVIACFWLEACTGPVDACTQQLEMEVAANPTKNRRVGKR
jgi:hypothetical protein